MLMKVGSSAVHADWLTMLPGCLLSGIGLGLTNTPVTNTATAAVSADRAGMASGIDMSARLITPAINIAVMGFILLEGVLSYLKRALPAFADEKQIQLLAEKVAAGDMRLLDHGPALATMNPHGAIAHAVLVHGFGLVMLYGGLGVWTLALLSVLTFGPGAQRRGAANYVA
jgi:hypothetical protein